MWTSTRSLLGPVSPTAACFGQLLSLATAVRGGSVAAAAAAVAVAVLRTGDGRIPGLATTAIVRLYVRELPWCKRDPSAEKKSWSDPAECRPCHRETIVDGPDAADEGAFRFGIVAAISTNRVIGVGGRLPWYVPEDRRLFEDLTRNKILIVGRRTYEEEEDGGHVSHVRWCIVVSSTADPNRYSEEEGVVLARSFPEALDVAKQLGATRREEMGKDGEGGNSNEYNDGYNDDDDDIDCWVGGGERLFEEALAHDSAFRIHVTTLRADVDVTGLSKRGVRFAFFPPKYRWDSRFRVVKRWEGEGSGGEASSGLTYSFCIYERK